MLGLTQNVGLSLAPPALSLALSGQMMPEHPCPRVEAISGT